MEVRLAQYSCLVWTNSPGIVSRERGESVWLDPFATRKKKAKSPRQCNEDKAREKRGASVCLWFCPEREKRKKERDSRKTVARCSACSWVSSLTTIATTQTIALVGSQNQRLAEKERDPFHQARECIPKHCQNTHTSIQVRAESHDHDKRH